MDLTTSALPQGEGVEALGFVDLSTGAVLELSARDDVSRQALELAALSACQLAVAPHLDPEGDDRGTANEVLVVSDLAVHALARCRRRPDLVALGIARVGANVGLVMASVRAVADAAGR